MSVADLTGVLAAAASRSTRTMSASLTPPLSAVSASVRACLHEPSKGVSATTQGRYAPLHGSRSGAGMDVLRARQRALHACITPADTCATPDTSQHPHWSALTSSTQRPGDSPFHTSMQSPGAAEPQTTCSHRH